MQYKAGTDASISDRERRNQEKVRRIAAQGMVLLENDGALPLPAGGRVALFGNGARRTVRGGTGSGDVNVRSNVSIEQGLENAGYAVVTKPWLDRWDEAVRGAEKEYADWVRAELKRTGEEAWMLLFTQPFTEPRLIPVLPEDLAEAETAVYVVSRIAGEGKDRTVTRGDYLLYEEDEQAIRLLAERYDRLVVVLNVGGVIDTAFLRECPGIGAVLLMGQAGMAGGDALADVLTGRVSPCGRLTDTWAQRYEDYPAASTFGAQNGNLDDEDYSEGIYVGYRWFDTFGLTPAYPFGYGLSYTTFSMCAEEVRMDGERVILSVGVTNTGARSGREVAQVYVSAPEGQLDKPMQSLAAYGKTKELAPGESQMLELSFRLSDAASYDEAASCYVLEPGEYAVRLGRHSRDTVLCALLCLSEERVTAKLRPIMPLDRPVPLCLPERRPYMSTHEEEERSSAPRIAVDPAAIPCLTAVYHDEEKPLAQRADFVRMEDVLAGRASAENLAAQLSPQELASLCVGAWPETTGNLDFIGQASNACPGAAGDTTSRLTASRGVPNLVMADGPAGLRLSRFFAVDADGRQVEGCGDQALTAMKLITGEPRPEAPEGATLHYQYCTAIPVGTVLAQSWDDALIEEAGDLVGGEMEEFGVALWLAPGMNIHRSPLCGRNFEYYSEDPLLSGRCAAADTRGVQRHKGCFTTIKHFACNSQEDNRMHMNAHVPERALREIYLKGFEIAVRESQPGALMTSYNLLNGIHTANARDLLQTVLRDEWGFAGVVMTDWGTTGTIEMDPEKTFRYGSSDPALCAAAGNDIVMPGSPADVEGILAGLEQGKVTLAALQACALRVLRTILKTL